MPPELALIESIRKKSLIRNGLVRVGIGDDAAVLRLRPTEEAVVTTDFSLEGVHFADFHPARSIGHRCLARGLSDIAAMGARPVAAFLSIALSRDWNRKAARMNGLMQGLLDLAAAHQVTLAGGDTAGAPGMHTVADIIVVGAVKRSQALLRSGARAGDHIYVTGSLGGSAAELEALRANPRRFQRSKADGTHPHLYPVPRVAVGQKLLGIASACMDISDGISTDLTHLCKASGTGAEIDARLLPIAPGASLEQALHGGEDYELLFTSRKKIPEKLAGVRVTRVGQIVEGEGIQLFSFESRKKLRPKGWEHLG